MWNVSETLMRTSKTGHFREAIVYWDWVGIMKSHHRNQFQFPQLFSFRREREKKRRSFWSEEIPPEIDYCYFFHLFRIPLIWDNHVGVRSKDWQGETLTRMGSLSHKVQPVLNVMPYILKLIDYSSKEIDSNLFSIIIKYVFRCIVAVARLDYFLLPSFQNEIPQCVHTEILW